jgi:hypothetical protein
MPFTPAHAAIVLPFVKLNHRYVSATGLIAGSVAPDFEYFLKFSVDSFYSHTLLAILYFNVPMSFLLSLCFHQVIKRNLIRNLPDFLQSRFQVILETDFPAYVKKFPMAVIVSCAVGAASHIFWDGFTHAGGYFVQHLSFYKGASLSFEGVNYPLWYALQHISTIIGLTVLCIYILLMERDKRNVYPQPMWRYWLFLVLITILVTCIRFVIHPSDFELGNFVVTVISGFCIGLIICGLIKFKRDPITR